MVANEYTDMEQVRPRSNKPTTVREWQSSENNDVAAIITRHTPTEEPSKKQVNRSMKDQGKISQWHTCDSVYGDGSVDCYSYCCVEVNVNIGRGAVLGVGHIPNVASGRICAEGAPI